jgi:hypothetical protein
LEKHPYRGRRQSASSTVDLVERLSAPAQQAPHTLALDIAEHLRSHNYRLFYQHVVERPVNSEIGGVSCAYFYNHKALVMLEQVFLPAKQDLCSRFNDDGVDLTFLYFNQSAAGIRRWLRPSDDLQRSLNNDIMHQVWAGFRIAQHHELGRHTPGELSAQRLTRAVNYARGKG